MQKEKPAIFTLSRQQKITPNCTGAGAEGWWGSGRVRDAVAAGDSGKPGGQLPGGGFSLPPHMCKSGPPGTA